MIHFTFDEYETTLNAMLKHVKSEIDFTKKDAQYYNKSTLKIIFRLRDSLTTALKASTELNALRYDSR